MAATCGITARKLGVALLGWALVVAGLAPAARAAEPSRAARLVSGDAIVYLEMLDPGAVIDRYADARVQSLLRAVPPYAKFAESQQYRELSMVAGFVAGALNTNVSDGLRELTGGGMVLAVEAQKGEKPKIVLIVTPRDPAFLARAHNTILTMARKDAADKGKPDPVKEGEYRGITGYSGGDGHVHAIVDGLLVISNNDAALKRVVDRALDKDKGQSSGSIVNDAVWKARRAEVATDALAWGFVRVDRLREMDANKFRVPDQVNPVIALLFDPWVESARKAPWLAANVTWKADRMAANITLPTPPGGYSDALKKYFPAGEGGAPALVRPPGTIASVSLFRDLASIWEVRADLFPPEVVQGFAKLDTFAGQYFGGRDFGTGVLGALAGNWRLIVARQDYQTMDPVPDVKLPAFALVIDLKPGDDDFKQRLKVAFQSFVGLANLGAAEQKSKAPPLELMTETVGGVTISSSRFMAVKGAPKDEPVHLRHNFSPSVAQVGDHFIFSSSLGLSRMLVKALQAPGGKRSAETLVADVEGFELAELVEFNQARMVMQNMVDKGNDKATAEKEIGRLVDLLRYLGRGTLTARDNADNVQLKLNLQLQAK